LAAAALSDRFDGSALELSGPKSITHGEIAAAIGTALGRNVTYVPLPPEAVGEAMRALGLDDWTAQLIVDYSRAYTKGFGDFCTDSVQQLTGHEPRSIATFAAEVMLPMAKSMGSS
jgi:NAD(P)H dehydrogenase (quinone)